MAKILIIDSLARSGTTLLSALINSQVKSAALRGIFHEPLALGLGSWPYGLAELPLIDKSNDIKIVNNFVASKLLDLDNNKCIRKYHSKLVSKMLLKLNIPLSLNINYMYRSSLDIIKSKSQTALYNYDEWIEFFSKKIINLSDLDILYQEIANLKKLNILSFRWNQGLFYAPKWLRNKNHYWCVIIRHPIDRAVSANKTFNWPYQKSLDASIAYSEKLDNLVNKDNFFIIYYEDLVNNTIDTIKMLYENINHLFDNIEIDKLYSQNGKSYRSESSDLVDKYGDHTIGKMFTGIYKDAIGRYEEVVCSSIVDNFYNKLKNSNVYSRYFR